ncbi:MAG: M66 family metalloprotease [Lentisphaeria bacterium]|nr:M66 family metalloprotease [Lentisphaeria bacterium]
MSEKQKQEDIVIDSVFFAQTHVMEPHHPYFRLSGGRDALIKAHVISPSGAAAPEVTAELTLGSESVVMALDGPTELPKSFCKEPGKVIHTFDDCFTAMIPGKWMAKGLKLTVRAGRQEAVFDTLNIGPPTTIRMTMFDIHYFDYADVDYPEGWTEELAVRWPVKSVEVQKLKRIRFPELIIPPRGDSAPAIRCTSEEDYEKQSGLEFNNKQAAALIWQKALRDAGGQKHVSLYLVNIANVKAGGFSESKDFGGCSALGRLPVLHHELGHALDVEDLNEEVLFPYRGAMYGIDKTTASGYHIGPTWGFDPRIGQPGAEEGKPFLISPIIPDNTVREVPGEWKSTPVMSGGGPAPEPGIPLKIFSDWSARKMQEFLDKWIVVWDEEKQCYMQWNGWHQVYLHKLKNDGVTYPVERDVEAYSVMVAVSAAKQDCNFIYPVIGPYTSGLLDTFDPTVEEDRKKARRLCSVGGPWDITLKIVQGGKTKTIMMPMQWTPDMNPCDDDAYQTRAVNLPARDGEIEKVELLLTPDAHINGMPDNPRVLYSLDGKVTPAEGTLEHFDCDLGKGSITWAFAGKTSPDYSKF